MDIWISLFKLQRTSRCSRMGWLIRFLSSISLGTRLWASTKRVPPCLGTHLSQQWSLCDGRAQPSTPCVNCAWGAPLITLIVRDELKKFGKGYTGTIEKGMRQFGKCYIGVLLIISGSWIMIRHNWSINQLFTLIMVHTSIKNKNCERWTQEVE